MKHALHTLENLLKREDADAGARGAVRRVTELLRPHDLGNPCWFMWVPTCFNDALDIQQTIRAIHECPRCNKARKGDKCPTCKKAINHVTLKKCGTCGNCADCESGTPCPNLKTCEICPDCRKCKTCRYCPDCQKYEMLEWTQGTGFNFAKGDTLYDTPLAQGQEQWSDSLKHFRYCIEVTQATLSNPAKLPPKETKKDDPDAKNAEPRPRYPGKVEFKLLVPKTDKTGLMLREICVMTQDEFVRLLITGESSKLKLVGADMLF